MEWFGNMQEISDEMFGRNWTNPTMTGLQSCSGGLASPDTSDFDWIHLYMTFQEMKLSIWSWAVWRCTFFSLTAKNKDVMHVDGHYPFINELFEDVIHHYLEVVGLFVKPKNLTKVQRDLSSSWRQFSTHLPPLIPHIIVSPTDVHFHEIFGFGFWDFVEDVLGSEGGVGILHGHCVKLSVALDQA